MKCCFLWKQQLITWKMIWETGEFFTNKMTIHAMNTKLLLIYYSRYGFKCLVVGYQDFFFRPNSSLDTKLINAFSQLEMELTYIGGMCAASLMNPTSLSCPGNHFIHNCYKYLTAYIILFYAFPKSRCNAFWDTTMHSWYICKFWIHSFLQ